MATHQDVVDTSPERRGNLRIFAIMIALSVRPTNHFSCLRRLTPIVQLAMFVAALDQTIMATAIPTITAKLHSAAGYTWIGGAYLLANAAGTCIWAKLSDIWGRKMILLIAVAWFFVSSIICSVSVSMPMLIAGRALQGLAGGGLIQLVTIVISDLFSVRYDPPCRCHIFTLTSTSADTAASISASWRSCGL